jgi:uncharacterized membrane protein YcjF (UPF0283 family)
MQNVHEDIQKLSEDIQNLTGDMKISSETVVQVVKIVLKHDTMMWQIKATNFIFLLCFAVVIWMLVKSENTYSVYF